MKKIVALILLVSVFTGLVGCGAEPVAPETQPTTTAAPETTAATEPTVTTAPTEPAMSAEDQAILTERRERVVAAMRHMMTFLWTSDVDITYSKQRTSTGLENDDSKNIITLKAGRIYSGLPYTHGSGSAYDFQAFATEQDENGVYHISGMNSTVLTGVDELTEFRRARVGNDCSDAVFWAWSSVSPTANFIATYEITEAFGAIPVGEYVCDPQKHSHTKEVCAQNGKDVMYKAYSQLQPGDAVVHNNSPESHAMLVSNVVVKYTKDGAVDFINSYIEVVHQTSYNLINEKFYYDQNVKDFVYYCGGIDDQYRFYKLFDEGYLPFTCKELIDPAAVEGEWVKDSEEIYTLENITAGTISSNFAISNVTLTILDTEGNEVQSATCFATESELKAFQMGRFVEEMEKDVMVGAYDLEGLPAGTYRCVVECLLSTGNSHTVRDYNFTK